MASVTKHPKSQFWTACYTNREGRQLKKSTKTTERNKALEIALELERVEKQAARGALTTTQLQKVLNDVAEKVTGDSIIAPAVEEYLSEWIQGVAARNTASTHERYGTTVRHFLKYLDTKSKSPITSITPSQIEGFLNARLKTGVAPKTAIIDIKTLKIAFRRAEAYGTILKSPVAVIRLPKEDSSERGTFSADEVQKLLEAAPTREWQTLILLGYFIGARLSDCVQMKWENVHPEEGVIIYHQKKTGKKVIVPMHYHIIEHLEFLTAFGTTGFLSPKLALKVSGGKHGLSEGFKRILNRAGIDPMTVPGKGTRLFTKRTFHSLRHSFNSALANAGVSQEIRMKLTGHTSPDMNNRYTHLEAAALKKAMSNLPILGSKQMK